MEAAAEAHRQAAAAQGSLQHPQGVEVADQGQGAPLSEAEAQPGHALAGGGAAGQGGGHGRRRNHHVVAQFGAADAAAAAALKGAVGHHGGGQGPLQILGQPALVHPAVDVVPGQALAAEVLQIRSLHRLGGAPAAHLQGAVAAP